MKASRRTILASAAGPFLALAQAPPEEAMAWIRSTAIRLRTPLAGHGFADLAPLKKVVGDARIVALGEATHGTREFFQLKHRLLEFLVTQMGFSILAIEAAMPQAYRLNDYVLTGEGDPAKLLKGLNNPLLDTEEVLEMIRWIRAYNQAGRGRVEFVGFDMQDPTVAMENVQRFLAEADPDFLPALSRAKEILQAAVAQDPAARKSVTGEWEKVLAHLESLRPRSAWAIQNARVVVQGLEQFLIGASPLARMQARDSSMATNVKWILDQSPGAKVVLWAHNFHVMTARDPLGAEVMGVRLRKMYGREMVTFGFVFNQGSFQAADPTWRLREFALGPAPTASLDATLAAAGIPLFALDLRSAPPSGPVREWLSAEHATRNAMQVFLENAPETITYPQVISQRYDALLFVDKTTATRPNQPKARK
ncbi:MAG: erythromycin esterase family protein [Bryobacteraceae bacterium]|nr:erythromycin esterase family protein [Bryobacteraceae bacterium]